MAIKFTADFGIVQGETQTVADIELLSESIATCRISVVRSNGRLKCSFKLYCSLENPCNSLKKVNLQFFSLHLHDGLMYSKDGHCL